MAASLVAMPAVRIAVIPPAAHLAQAARRGGASSSEPADADGIIWTDPADPAGLAAALRDSPARWVQLPFAGIEGFFAAGVIDAGRTWTCAKGIYGRPTAEGALALMLALARRIPEHAAAREWGMAPDGRTLDGATAAILGTGGIGTALAAMLRPLGCTTVGLNRSGRPAAGFDRTAPSVDVAGAAAEADWLVLAAPLTDETRGIASAEVLEALGPGGFVVNVARGELADTGALVAALQAGAIAGAGLDVTDPEPLPAGHPLWELPNVIITSHTANTETFRIPLLARLVEENVRRFAAGEPLAGIVDVEAGY